jgi:site-specific DNA recombinase
VSPSPHSRSAAIYVRVSTEDQARGFSLPTQLEACQKLAEHEGYSVPEPYVLTDDLTGDQLDRRGLRRLRELVQTQAIRAAIVYELDRLSRKMVHQLLFEEECERSGVALLVVTDPIEVGPEGALRRHIKGAFAEWEKAKILERTKRGMLGRANAGNPWGGQVALGYRAIREAHRARWEIDEEAAALVRQIFAMCLSGMSTYAITEQLSRERVPTPRERGAAGGRSRLRTPGIWNEATVYKILTNEAYTGRAYFGKYRCTSKNTRVRRPPAEWIAIPVPAIIDRDTFEAAQWQLERNRALATRNRKHDYLLIGGRFRCGRCGRAMTARAPKGRRRYYCNSLRTPHDHEHTCRGWAAAEDVECQVWAAVVRILEQPEVIAEEVHWQQATAEDQRAEVRRELALVEAGLATCDRETQKWERAYLNDAIDVADFKAKKAELSTRRQGWLAQRAEADAKLEAIGQAVAQVGALIDYCARVRQALQTFDDAEKRLAFDALDIRVSWTPGQPLSIQGTIPMEAIAPIPPGSHRRCSGDCESRA